MSDFGLIDMFVAGYDPFAQDQDSDETVDFDPPDYPSDADFVTLDEVAPDSDNNLNVRSPVMSQPRNAVEPNTSDEQQNIQALNLNEDYEQLQAMQRQHRRSGPVQALNLPTHDRDLWDLADEPVIVNAEDSEILPRNRNRAIDVPLLVSSSDEESIPGNVDQVQNNENNDAPQSPVLMPPRPNVSSGTQRSNRGAIQPSSEFVHLIVSPPRTRSTQSDFHASEVQGASAAIVKRKHSPQADTDAKKVAVDPTVNLDDSQDDGMSCPICFEPWTNSGSHRLTSLRCGHIFGQKCIERWLKDCHQKCPQCNAKAKRTDLRIIYAKKLATLDTTELEHALKNLDRERTNRRECEMDLAKVRMQYHIADEECSRLKSQVTSLKMQLTAYKEKSPLVSTSQPSSTYTSSSQSSSANKSFHCIRSSVITQSGGCRVMDFNPRTHQFVISHPSPHASFMMGYGVKRISAHDLRGNGFFTILHQKPIKDLKFSQHTGHLLSASQDGTLRITDISSSVKIHEYKLEKPVWSCCWDSKDRNIMYAGLSNGTLVQFDLRNTSESLSFIENASSKCPIVSLYHIPPTATEFFQGRGGLLTGTLEGASFWQDIGCQDNEGPSVISSFRPILLPLSPGSCTGLHYCPKPQCFLTTYRPGRNYRTTTHLLCELRCQSTGGETPNVSCNVIDSYTGGQTHKMLTRNSLVVLPSPHQNSTEDSLLVCVGDEARSQVQVYDSNRSKLLQSLDSDGGPALDILPANVESAPPMLSVLSQNTLKVFQYK